MGSQVWFAHQKKFDNAMQALKQSGVSRDFIFNSPHAHSPQTLSFHLKTAYQQAGLTDERHHLTALGEAFFKQVKNAAESPRPQLPKVASTMHLD